MALPTYISSFWGKARPADSAGPKWHPLAYHMLDVAAVARALLKARRLTRARAAWLLGMTEDEVNVILPVIAGLHDLGKFGRAFQSKASDFWNEAQSGTEIPRFISTRRHDADGWLVWAEGGVANNVTGSVWPEARNALDILMMASVAHHGRPICRSAADAKLFLAFGPGVLAAQAFSADIVRLLVAKPVTSAPPKDNDAYRTSHWLAGFVTLSDWVGSNTYWFPYRAPDLDMAAYWNMTCTMADDAVRDAGLRGALPAPLASFAQVSGMDAPPSPVQHWAETVTLPKEPSLIIIEDVTGSGKTEAAQMLVHRLMEMGLGSGAYWAMPTQATANAMYDRQAKMISRLFHADTHPYLALAHGQAALSDPFQSSILRDGRAEIAYGNGQDDADYTASASCAAWLAHDRRTALIADVGAGTIDQALLAVLPAKFNTMRLFGLAEKILVLDEAHAYDAYVQAEIEGLLAFQAALGGSAIILSATLPLEMRRQFARSWQRAMGIRHPPTPVTKSDGYPLATIVRKSAVEEYPLGAADRGRRKVPVRLIHHETEAIAAIQSAAKAGAAVVWIRNTVDDALIAADLLRAENVEPLLFHARFAQYDRQRREAEIMAIFGKNGTTKNRRGRVLIATQVVEQSLDLDFDLMVSDLAPVDLLIQRAGRLRRHPERDAARPASVPFELVVLTPPFADEPDENWIREKLPGTAAVYRNPTILWRTARALARENAIVAPDGLRELVEEVYDGLLAPEALSRATLRAEGEASAHRTQGQQARLNPGDGYSGEQVQWTDERKIETRISDNSITIRLGKLGDDSAIIPWAQESSAWKAWALSEVRVRPLRIAPDARPPDRLAKAAAAARATWKRFEQEIPLLVLEPEGGGRWTGSFLTVKDGRERQIAYDEISGLSFQISS